MKIKAFLPQIILIFIFLLTLIVNLQIGLFGDDYYYATFIRNNFWELHKAHYLDINGRIIVHFLDSIFLAIPRIFWQLFNSVMLTGIAYFGSKIVCEISSKKENSFIKSLIIFAFGIFMLHIYVIRQSIYWTTGSFNYIYPLFMLMWYWYILFKYDKNNFKGIKLFYTTLLAFFASATVEQGGMMVFGLTLLFFLYKLIINKKENKTANFKKLLLILIFSFIGVASVTITPSQFIRFGLETKENYNVINSMKEYIKFLINTFVIKDFYRPQILLLLLSVILSIITLKKSKKFNDLESFTLITAFILGAGSQLMLIISPVYGERNTLFIAIMIFLFTSLLMVRIPDFKINIFKSLEISFYFILLTVSTINMLNIYKNYKITNEIQNQNIKILDSYKENKNTDDKIVKRISYLNQKPNNTIELTKFADDKYGWSMPYISPYHENWFKIYYDIKDYEIIWKDYANKQ